jgi:hypothetical protein
MMSRWRFERRGAEPELEVLWVLPDENRPDLGAMCSEGKTALWQTGIWAVWHMMERFQQQTSVSPIAPNAYDPAIRCGGHAHQPAEKVAPGRTAAAIKAKQEPASKRVITQTG